MSESIHSSARFHGDLPSATSDKAFLDHKELAATAFERTRMPITIADARAPDVPIVLANEAFLQLTGYGADEVIGRNCRFLQGAGTSPVAVAEVRAGIKEQREVSVEILNYRKDGSAFWNKLHLSPIHDDDGQLIYWFASQIDDTQFRKVQSLEASEHRLLMEVDHRAKNVLAIVDSIVRLSNASDPHLYAASIQHRVQALSRVHGLFSERGWSDIPLEDVARLQVQPFVGSRATFKGPPVMLSPIMLQPLGLIFHELATNAASHGALEDGKGTVSVEWTTNDGQLIISWSEAPIASTAGARAKGFGTVMIDAMAERQLNGQIEREWGPDSLTAVVTLPLGVLGA
ncbi:PAS domain-containing protein [Rhizobium sp. TH2]|uniref:blue-light-activated histidine kinase n=1 Tax=Rhizobium sp. TH2 TaxID=2775403 RepID=UPI002157A15D|nr:PAS domain-containing protein [Rhizobium sp. TH2]